MKANTFLYKNTHLQIKLYYFTAYIKQPHLVMHNYFFWEGEGNWKIYYKSADIHVCNNYVQKEEKVTRKNYKTGRGEGAKNGNYLETLTAALLNHNAAVQLIFMVNGLLPSTYSFYISL